ncbi:MAG: DoxX family protein [Chlamydiia bacterium]|nr:DoxX family protein [Chlamydiia bacterium]
MLSRLNASLRSLECFGDLPPLFFRLMLAYGFFTPALNKVTHFSNVVTWFEGMNFILPTLSAGLAATAEALGVVLLFLGLGTRLIALPLMFVMLVAIFAVHWPNGFSAVANGIEVPLYYFLMLFSLLIGGPGRYSLDHSMRGR